MKLTIHDALVQTRTDNFIRVLYTSFSGTSLLKRGCFIAHLCNNQSQHFCKAIHWNWLTSLLMSSEFLTNAYCKYSFQSPYFKLLWINIWKNTKCAFSGQNFPFHKLREILKLHQCSTFTKNATLFKVKIHWTRTTIDSC